MTDETDLLLDRLAAEDAADREAGIAVRGVMQQPPLPKIFRLIIENYDRRQVLKSRGADISQKEWRELKELHLDMRRSLRPGAERALAPGPV
jgi:hypothetical protein